MLNYNKIKKDMKMTECKCVAEFIIFIIDNYGDCNTFTKKYGIEFKHYQAAKELLENPLYLQN